MQSGPKAGNPATKKLAGTFRSDRHANVKALAAAQDTKPVQPDYLTAEAKAVWMENISRVVGVGATDLDSDLFARYCILEALFRMAVTKGDIPQGTLYRELRSLAELLGIAGVKSRLAKVGSEAPAKPTFTVRPN